MRERKKKVEEKGGGTAVLELNYNRQHKLLSFLRGNLNKATGKRGYRLAAPRAAPLPKSKMNAAPVTVCLSLNIHVCVPTPFCQWHQRLR